MDDIIVLLLDILLFLCAHSFLILLQKYPRCLDVGLYGQYQRVEVAEQCFTSDEHLEVDLEHLFIKVFWECVQKEHFDCLLCIVVHGVPPNTQRCSVKLTLLSLIFGFREAAHSRIYARHQILCLFLVFLRHFDVGCRDAELFRPSLVTIHNLAGYKQTLIFVLFAALYL